ncbi:MAG: hypothetical protein GEV06_14275 [Luteitalea sp.]|nr:hypothetical protein [Luteitalea sp.]
MLALPEGQGGDAIRYVWDARVQRAGLDPYRARPNDPALSGLHSDLVWYLRSLDGSWIVPVPLLTLEYGAVAVAALWLAMGLTRNLYPETRGGAARRRRRSPSRLHSPCHLVTLSPASCCVGHPWALRAGGGAVRIPQSEGR